MATTSQPAENLTGTQDRETVILVQEIHKYYELGETRVHALRGVSVEIARGACSCRTRRPHHPFPLTTLRRPTAASGDRTRPGESAIDPAGGRAHGQSRQSDLSRDHGHFPEIE